MNLPAFTIEQTCKIYGCTAAQLKKQYEANAKELHDSSLRAATSQNGLYRKRTAAEWKQDAVKYDGIVASFNS